MNNNMFSKAAVWLVIALVLFTVFKQFDKPRVQEGVSYSQFMDDAKSGKVKTVTVQGRNLTVTPADGQKYQIVSPGDIWMVGDLMKYGVQVSGKADDEPNALVSALYYLGPTILIIGFWFFMMRQMQGGGKGGAFSFGKSRARLIDENNNAINFTDVAGCDEAKEEVSELVDFLRDPQKFQKLGGRIPRGVLLVGPPGTGKTLLARAIAGEAKVPFFSISGSDFVEMFVGVGAARVRDMFEQAKKHAPCIVFIDEIDAVGRHRGAGMGGGNDEREQTLNQMLVEMDGFEANSGVMFMNTARSVTSRRRRSRSSWAASGDHRPMSDSHAPVATSRMKDAPVAAATARAQRASHRKSTPNGTPSGLHSVTTRVSAAADSRPAWSW